MLENEVSFVCSYFSFGTMASSVAFPVSFSYKDSRCDHDMPILYENGK